jgi:uncharacterized membrane protein
LIALLVRRTTGIEVKRSVVQIGIILAVSQLTLLAGMITRPIAGVMILALAGGVCLAVLIIRRIWPEKMWLLQSPANVLVMCSHLLDATVTFVGVDFYPYGEQHVLPNALISFFGTGAVMYVLKIVALFVVLYLLDKYVDDEEMNIFVKMIIMVLGMAPATRNFLRIIIAS